MDWVDKFDACYDLRHPICIKIRIFQPVPTEIISLNIGNLREDIWERMAQIASWEQMDKRTHRQHKGMAVSSIGEILERNKYLYRVSILLQPFSGQCVEDGYFSFGNDKMQCQVLSRIDRRQVETGYLYAFHAP